MSIKQFKPYTPGRRQMTIQGREDITADKPERSLVRELRKHGGRNNTGRITMRHIGGGHRRAYRIMAFGHPWVKVGRSLEELWLNLRHGNFAYIGQSIRNRIHKWMGRKTYY